MQQTSKYQFNLIEPEDKFLPTPLNQNMEKVEAIISQEVGVLQEGLGSGGYTARIAWGSYTGNGTYGAANANSLTFDFCPVLVFIVRATNSREVIFVREKTQYSAGLGGASVFYNTSTWEGHTLSWYASSGSSATADQMNEADQIYFWVAIGYDDSMA